MCSAPDQDFKVALLFLTRADWLHPSIWNAYISSVPGRFSVYCHPKHPEGVADPTLGRGILPATVPTEWGTVSLVRATLLLLEAALADRDNRFFMLLSESCLPIKPAGELLGLLAGDARSWIGWQTPDEVSAVAPQKAVRTADAPGVASGNWRFHDQWMLLNRQHAETVTRAGGTDQFAGMFAPDEAYFATTLAAAGVDFDTGVRRRSPTFVCWSAPTRAHPISFRRMTPELRGELEGTDQWFARKFNLRRRAHSYRLHLPP